LQHHVFGENSGQLYVSKKRGRGAKQSSGNAAFQQEFWHEFLFYVTVEVTRLNFC